MLKSESKRENEKWRKMGSAAAQLARLKEHHASIGRGSGGEQLGWDIPPSRARLPRWGAFRDVWFPKCDVTVESTQHDLREYHTTRTFWMLVGRLFGSRAIALAARKLYPAKLYGQLFIAAGEYIW